MDDMRLKMYRPVTSGTPGIEQHIRQNTNTAQNTETESFQDILKAQLDKNSNVAFSRHAVKRAVEKNIELSDDSIERLNEGVRLAGEKNLNDTLILVGGTAFVVNIKNNTVITAVDSSEMKGNVFTNIEGTVIV